MVKKDLLQSLKQQMNNAKSPVLGYLAKKEHAILNMEEYVTE
jgi:hypothetical protein